MLRRYQSQFRSCVTGCGSYRDNHVSSVDPLCFPLFLLTIILLLLEAFFFLTPSPVTDPKGKTRT